MQIDNNTLNVTTLRCDWLIVEDNHDFVKYKTNCTETKSRLNYNNSNSKKIQYPQQEKCYIYSIPTSQQDEQQQQAAASRKSSS